jgi:hypothetical protein
MHLVIKSPKLSLNKAYLKESVLRSSIDKLKANLSILVGNIDHEESEENVKNHLRDFLNNTWYGGNYLLNTKKRTDLVIFPDNNQNSKASLLMEVKRPKNKSEMVTKKNLNFKAMHELILYYLEERILSKNNDIRFLIATNIYEWFIFDARIFEDLFFNNSSLVKEFKSWKEKQKVATDTELFYKEIAKPFLQSLIKEITFTYFDIRDFWESLKNPGKKEDENAAIFYKILSPSIC